MKSRAEDATWATPRPPHIPRWAHFLGRFPTSNRCVFDYLVHLGFWDMDDGDWYVNGHWNWRCWETWDRHHAMYVGLGWSAPQWMPWFPRTMKRVFGR